MYSRVCTGYVIYTPSPIHLLTRLKTPLAGTLNFQTFLPVNMRFTTSSATMARGNGQLINIYFAVSGAGNAHDQLLVMRYRETLPVSEPSETITSALPLLVIISSYHSGTLTLYTLILRESTGKFFGL